MPTIYLNEQPVVVSQARYNDLIKRKGWYATPTPRTSEEFKPVADDDDPESTTSEYDALWNTGNQICVPTPSGQGAATLSPTSGTAYLTGGPGMVVPAGVEVQGISFVSGAANVTPTHQFAFIAVPDETGLNQAVLVAVSGDLLNAAWAANAVKKFSFRTEDGGSGFWTPQVDTPIYGGICQVAGTPSTLRGFTSNGFLGAQMTPKWFASALGGGKVYPKDLHTVMLLNDSATYPFCRVSRTYN